MGSWCFNTNISLLYYVSLNKRSEPAPKTKHHTTTEKHVTPPLEKTATWNKPASAPTQVVQQAHKNDDLHKRDAQPKKTVVATASKKPIIVPPKKHRKTTASHTKTHNKREVDHGNIKKTVYKKKTTTVSPKKKPAITKKHGNPKKTVTKKVDDRDKTRKQR